MAEGRTMSRRRVRPRQTPPPDWTIVDSHEPSAWLRNAAATRLRALANDEHSMATAPSADFIVCSLSGLPTNTGSAEDYTCDRCRRYCGASADEFHVFALPVKSARRGQPSVVLAGGLCADCAAREWGAS